MVAALDAPDDHGDEDGDLGDEVEHAPDHAHEELHGGVRVPADVGKEGERGLDNDEQADVVGDGDGAGELGAKAHLVEVVGRVDLGEDEEHVADGDARRAAVDVSREVGVAHEKAEHGEDARAQQDEHHDGADMIISEGPAAALVAAGQKALPRLGVEAAQDPALEDVGEQDDEDDAAHEDERAVRQHLGQRAVLERVDLGALVPPAGDARACHCRGCAPSQVQLVQSVSLSVPVWFLYILTANCHGRDAAEDEQRGSVCPAPAATRKKNGRKRVPRRGLNDARLFFLSILKGLRGSKMGISRRKVPGQEASRVTSDQFILVSPFQSLRMFVDTRPSQAVGSAGPISVACCCCWMCPGFWYF